MRPLPVADPGVPDVRSATRYLFWLARRIPVPLGLASFFGVLWLGSQALVPVVIREAVDHGLVPGDTGAVLRWAAVLLGLGVVQAVSGTVRRRLSIYNALSAGFRTVQLVAGHANRVGATLSRRVDEGELVSVGASDMSAIGNAFDIVGRTVGALVSLVVVAVVLVGQSTSLGLLLLVLPVIIVLTGYTLRPLHRRQDAYRDLQGELTSRLTDVVTGIRVLSGVGGETSFARSYRERSQRVRQAGVRVAGAEALIRASQVLLPGILIAAVTWLGARGVVEGSVTPGELVSFYAYAAFLVEPLGVFTDTANRFAKAHVAARRAVTVLRLVPPEQGGETGGLGELVDERSGLTVRSGEFLAVVASHAEGAELADRLGGFTEERVSYGGLPLPAWDLERLRRRVLVVDGDSRLFRGRLRDSLDPHGAAPETALAAALRAAAAEDVVAALPEGLDTEITGDGRRFSGGQRQRLVLARAVLADPDVLVALDPTSAVDAHTENEIGHRLRAARAGRTTVVISASPLLLEQAGRVAWLCDGRVAATGSHRELFAAHAGYRLSVQHQTGEDLPSAAVVGRNAE